MKISTLIASAFLLLALPLAVNAQAPAGGDAPPPGAGRAGGGGGRGGGTPMAPQLISFDMAKRIVDAAEASSRANNWNMTIVVVDAAGVPIYLRRLPNSAARSYDLATGKARTVVASKMSTEAYRQGVEAGTVTAIPDAVTFSGGIPVLVNGEFAGAIGVSGSTQDNDVVVALAGLAAMGN